MKGSWYAEYIQIISKRLTTMGYSLTATNYGVAFDLIEGVPGEIIIGDCNKQHIELSVLITVSVIPHDDLDLFSLSLSPYLTPVKISTLEDKVNLHLDVKGISKSINPLITESVLLLRYMAGAVYTEVFNLTNHKADLFKAFENTLKHLQRERLATP